MTWTEVSLHVQDAQTNARAANMSPDEAAAAMFVGFSGARWVRALIALLQWAPPVEARPKLHGPSPEALARGLVVGAVVRTASRRRMTVLGYSTYGHVVTCDGLWHPGNLTVVLPPPALDSWLLDAHAVESYVHHAAVPRFIAEARRLVELVRGGAR